MHMYIPNEKMKSVVRNYIGENLLVEQKELINMYYKYNKKLSVIGLSLFLDTHQEVHTFETIAFNQYAILSDWERFSNMKIFDMDKDSNFFTLLTSIIILDNK